MNEAFLRFPFIAAGGLPQKCPVPQCVFTDADGGAARMRDGFPVRLPPRAEG